MTAADRVSTGNRVWVWAAHALAEALRWAVNKARIKALFQRKKDKLHPASIELWEDDQDGTVEQCRRWDVYLCTRLAESLPEEEATKVHQYFGLMWEYPLASMASSHEYEKKEPKLTIERFERLGALLVRLAANEAGRRVVIDSRFARDAMSKMLNVCEFPADRKQTLEVRWVHA